MDKERKRSLPFTYREVTKLLFGSMGNEVKIQEASLNPIAGSVGMDQALL
jgi:hypothetical protein